MLRMFDLSKDHIDMNEMKLILSTYPERNDFRCLDIQQTERNWAFAKQRRSLSSDDPKRYHIIFYVSKLFIINSITAGHAK